NQAAPPDPRPTVLDRLGPKLAPLADRRGARAAGHRRTVASRLAPPPMDPTFETPIGRPSTYRSADPRPRQRDGAGKPVVGSTADSWRAAHPRCRRLRTDGVASAATAPTSVFANVADIPHESHR